MLGSWRPSPATGRSLIAAAIVIGLLFLVVTTSSFWITLWWFESLGYRSVFLTQYLSGAATFVVAAVLAGLFVWLNGSIALRESGRNTRPAPPRGVDRWLRWGVVAAAVVTAIVSGWRAALRWETYRLFIAGTEFGVAEPIYGRDAGFYVFTLPALTSLQRGAVALTIATILLVGVLAIVRQLRWGAFDVQTVPARTRSHLLALGALLLVLFAVGYVLGNFELLYSTLGYVYGAGFTDVNVVRPLNFILAAASIAAAAILVGNARRLAVRPLTITGIVWVAAVLLGAVLPAFVQQAVVEPSELSRERPYIANNIALTRSAFNLDATEVREISGQGEPSPSALSADSPTLDNIRLWDYRIAGTTYQQLRSFVPYYVFPDVDVDRYRIDGELRQVLIAARELDVDQLPGNVQTWTNRHLAYTHGYGVVVSPISEATRQGLPVFLVGGIPPEGTGELAITRPEIYFGETGENWVAIKTDVSEINGLSGETASASYDGTARGAISVGNRLQRLLLAAYLGDRSVVLNAEMTDESQVLLRRSIADRAQAVVPFLTLDSDPYLVIVDGRLVWVVDAYAATDRFPGSTPIEGVNYLRHVARLTIDAYEGSVTAYRTSTPDPIVDAYSRIYPNVFRPIAEAPAALVPHFRYPERLFDLQSEVYASYHVTDPAAFYNGEDRWEVPIEEVESGRRGESALGQMEAYYMTLPLPGETEASFKLVRPFTPNNRQNMTAWMAAQSAEDGTPRLVVFRFPRQSNIFGPQQVEARINQDPEVSSQITLLDRSGSRVIRGNLLVIPLESTVLYAQPLYLQATQTDGAPSELRFVIVATNEQVEMRPTLAEALAAVAGADVAEGSVPNQNVEGDSLPSPPDVAVLAGDQARDALVALERAQDARDRGNLFEYEEALVDLRVILEGIAASDDAVPVDDRAAATPTP